MSQSYDPPPPRQPELGKLAQPELGSLTQSVRKKGLGAAHGWLIFVGIITILFNIAMFFLFDEMVKAELAKHPGAVIDPDKLEQLRRLNYLIYGGTIALGVVFIILGALVYRFPVVCTVAGLVLYLGAQALFGFFDPENLYKGLLIKIIIIAALAKAIQAALAYEKEERSRRDINPGYGA